MPRLVILGCGTGVGKTRLSAAVLRELARRRQPCVGLKPIESGVSTPAMGPAAGSDAATLNAASTLQWAGAHPLYALPEPISPHLAARHAGLTLELPRVVDWVAQVEAQVATHTLPHSAPWYVIESAGGVLSPLAVGVTNFDLALALEPSIWVVVATDALGVLHDVSATFEAMRARGRLPDHLVLSQARPPDASTGSNAQELHSLGIATPSALLERDDDSGVARLVDALLSQAPAPPA